MSLIPNSFGLYLVITQPMTSYEHCADAAVSAQVRFIQLRMKHTNRCDILKTALKLRKITEKSSTSFIVNDDPEIATDSGADGVHLGQNDMSIIEARKKFPGLKLFGLSTHSIEQVLRAKEQRPNYIGIGPVFKTPTKEIPDTPLGIKIASQMASIASCPSVAIGGLNTNNICQLANTTSINNIALVRAVCQSENPFTAIKQIQYMIATYLQ